MDLHAPQSGVIPRSSIHFKSGPAADLDKSCPSGSMFTGSDSAGPTGNPDLSSTKGTNSPTSFTTVIGRQSFRLLATKTLLIISAPTVILAATILPIELNCRCKNELGYCWHEVNQESQLTPWIQTERTSLSLRVPLRRSHADYAWNLEPQQGCCAQNRHSSRHCGGTLAQRLVPNEIQHSFFPSIASWLSRGRSTR